MLSLSKSFEVLRTIYQNRKQRYFTCRTKEEENAITPEEAILGSKERVREFGIRFAAFENDETFLEDALTYLFVNRKIRVKEKYTYEELIDTVREAMGERNAFMRECMRQSNASIEESTLTLHG